jgi:hypothetical protein
MWSDYETALGKYRQALQVVIDEETRQALDFACSRYALYLGGNGSSVYEELFKLTQNQGMQGVLLHKNIAMIHIDQGENDMAVEEFNLAFWIKRLRPWTVSGKL